MNVCHGLTVFSGSHCTSIYVHVRVYLDGCYLEASRLQEETGRGGYAFDMSTELGRWKMLPRTNDALSNPANHTSRNKDELCHYRWMKKDKKNSNIVECKTSAVLASGRLVRKSLVSYARPHILRTFN